MPATGYLRYVAFGSRILPGYVAHWKSLMVTNEHYRL
ncbi:hypothetical protein BN2476_780007 [Paraburkholderia piptadeniae]|uniref:Uncharacterized protein n=1 Tax=Paraburkholderia piptadeniae TaxID=1701573 RepID=A0A1N7STS6_9BURK|nr:hypothetical protein BN2476_780007 [Paraburkholderia piptadeniae]